MRIVESSSNLRIDEHGVWTSSEVPAVAYPTDGNSRCYQLEDSSFWFQHRNNCIVSVVRRFPPSGPILDVGGGNGYVTKRMIDEGFEAVLLEPGAAGALNAKTQRHVPEVICATLDTAGFAPKSLAAVGLFDVVEHVEDDRAFIRHVHDLLKPGGMLYVTVPAHQWLWSSSDMTAGHYRRYDRRSVINILDEKFDIQFFTYFFAALMLPVLFLRTIPLKVGMSRKREVLSPESEHGTRGGAGAGILRLLLEKEVGRIDRGFEVPVGTSCLFAARKIGA